MLFNSASFALFLPVVFLLYWFVANRTLKIQNALLFAASYFFYACWDYRFLALLAFSTLLDYFTAIKMAEAKKKNIKKTWFWISISVNVGFLAAFKYYNFFIASFATAVAHLGLHFNPWTFHIILPIGISFYTFHGLSYVIDIYYDRIKPERNFMTYAVFVSFFPLLVAGPIERAWHLLPQLKKERRFDYAIAVDGLRQILWGLFKKVVIADTCAKYVNTIFHDPGLYSGSTLLAGAILFAFQIYCDFSGYSDIAIGTAKLFGIDLLRNFAFPYFSRDIAEFWRRWHISLTTWFRDYLYIPLGGSRGGTARKIRNTFIIFLVSGLWHGANWTFIAWGLIHAIYFLPLLLLNKNRNNIGTIAEGRILPTLREAAAMTLTFALTTFAWIFFRSPNLHAAFAYIQGMANHSLFSMPQLLPKRLIAILFVFILLEWQSRSKKHALQFSSAKITWPIRYAFYLIIGYSIVFYQNYHNPSEFIYFQF